MIERNGEESLTSQRNLYMGKLSVGSLSLSLSRPCLLIVTTFFTF